jgi:crotonobetainyl-CoA:carnitine CoA-transferase CaiB-like acyl-CoA transferase
MNSADSISASETRTRGPLAGVRVLDFTAMIAGPYCTRLLADAGAEVVKIEPPDGDYMRGREPLRQAADGSLHSAYYGSLNCGKHSVVIDMRTPQGRKLATDLAVRADVVVENFRPGVMARLELGHERLRAGNPRLVYCSISGYGQEGPQPQRPAYAPVMHAACGFDLANLGYQDGLDRPLKNGIFIADILSGVHAFGAINAALLRRERSGEGEYIDIALMDAMLGLLVYECQEAQFPTAARRPLYRPLKTRDGFVIVAPISAANFRAMAEAVGHPEWIGDPRFADTASRTRNWDTLMDLMEQWAATRTIRECESTMLAGGVPFSRYATVREAMTEQSTASRGTLAAVHDAAGEFLVPNAAFKMRDAGARNWVDSLGGSGSTILERWLGLGEQGQPFESAARGSPSGSANA